MFFDPLYFLFLAPALLLAMWAQFRVHSAYAKAQEQPANLSGPPPPDTFSTRPV